jgi:RNA polymerase sigma-70 factor (ECF subfamily)
LVLARSHDGIAGDEASDLVQKTLLAAYSQREQFHGRTKGELVAWLKQILRNQAIDSYRQQRRLKRDVAREVPLDAGWDDSFARADAWLAAAQSSPSQRVSKDEELVRLADALAGLPEAQREAIVLHHLQGVPLAEVANRLRRTPPAVAGLLQRGLKQLRQRLDNVLQP